MFIGFLILLVGILMLLDKFGLIHGSFWDYVWPVALIALGLSMVIRNKNSKW